MGLSPSPHSLLVSHVERQGAARNSVHIMVIPEGAFRVRDRRGVSFSEPWKALDLALKCLGELPIFIAILFILLY